MRIGCVHIIMSHTRFIRLHEEYYSAESREGERGREREIDTWSEIESPRIVAAVIYVYIVYINYVRILFCTLVVISCVYTI